LDNKEAGHFTLHHLLCFLVLCGLVLVVDSLLPILL
jgi:hypothetical protein